MLRALPNPSVKLTRNGRLHRPRGAHGNVAPRGGSTPTTQIGLVNRNSQLCTRTRGIAGTDYEQVASRMLCLEATCGALYSSSGTDVFQRKYPKFQGDAEGITY
jgi:hypothetical protein